MADAPSQPEPLSPVDIYKRLGVISFNVDVAFGINGRSGATTGELLGEMRAVLLGVQNMVNSLRFEICNESERLRNERTNDG